MYIYTYLSPHQLFTSHIKIPLNIKTKTLLVWSGTDSGARLITTRQQRNARKVIFYSI